MQRHVPFPGNFEYHGCSEKPTTAPLTLLPASMSQLHLSIHSLQHPATVSPHTRPKPLWPHHKRLRPSSSRTTLVHRAAKHL
ncbi:hypothetical protein JB92DRAFT_2871730 [Gautieria morchelliformis]|nr:hypothetical protein JB92DRAFT_2871730 [Gautieria morchelliformis]